MPLRPRLALRVRKLDSPAAVTASGRPFFAVPLVITLALATARPAHADGGAHVVDSANVETPGLCHLENWLTRFDSARGLANVSAACTPLTSPGLEVGASVQRTWDHQAAVTAGPALKLGLRPTNTGLGIGVIASAGFGMRTARTETAALIVPVSLPISERILVNLNGGWSYAAHSAHRTQAFYGVQAQAVVWRDFSVMTEIFGNNRERPGVQAGLRWTPGGGRLDLDMLVGQRVDGSDAQAITLGVTVRR